MVFVAGTSPASDAANTAYTDQSKREDMKKGNEICSPTASDS